MTTQRIGFLIWPSTRPLTLALAEEVLLVAQRVHPDVVYEMAFLQAEPAQEGAGACRATRGLAAWRGATSCFWLLTSRLRQ